MVAKEGFFSAHTEAETNTPYINTEICMKIDALCVLCCMEILYQIVVSMYKHFLYGCDATWGALWDCRSCTMFHVVSSGAMEGFFHSTENEL